MMRPTTYLCAGLLIAAAGCSKKKRTDRAFPNPILAGLKKAGLEVGSFDKADPKPYGAQTCRQGRVADLHVLLCRFADEEGAATATAKRLYRFVRPAVTGVVRRAGRVTIVVADRDKQDLRGKRISKILRTFAKLRGKKKPLPKIN